MRKTLFGFRDPRSDLFRDSHFCCRTSAGPVLVRVPLLGSVHFAESASFKGRKQELSGPVWLDLGFKSFQQKILGSPLRQMVHMVWDCPYHMIDFI